MPPESLRCKECQTVYPLDARYVCERCFGPLEVAYAAPESVDPAELRLDTVPDRVKQVGDPSEGMHDLPGSLDKLLQLAQRHEIPSLEGGDVLTQNGERSRRRNVGPIDRSQERALPRTR